MVPRRHRRPLSGRPAGPGARACTFVFELGPTQSYGTRIEIPIAKPEHRIHYKYVSKFVQPASPSGHWRACFEWTQGDGTQGRRCGVDRTYTTSLPACDDLNTEGIVGTDGPERLDGTDGAERIQAMAGNDTILAGDGRDCIEAGGGSDKIYAGRGDDRIEAEDDVQEMVDCGGGTRDVAIVDSIDSTRGCEVVAAG